MKKKNIANYITFSRIISTLVMAFSKVTGNIFKVAYIYAGLSDVLDGFAARKLHIESEFGKKLDSISDLFFYTTMMIKIWPYLTKYLPWQIWGMIWTTFGFRVALYFYVSLAHNRFLSNHTYLNKATGFLLFFVPFMIETTFFVNYSTLVVSVALIAVIYEMTIVIKKRSV